MPNIPKTYTVAPGDTLSSIAKKFFKNANRWYDIWAMNMKMVPNPDHIRPGQVLALVDDPEGNVPTSPSWEEAKVFVPFSCLFGCVEHQRTEIRDLVKMLTMLRDEYKKLPHSLGYEFTHMPQVDAKLAEYGIAKPE